MCFAVIYMKIGMCMCVSVFICSLVTLIYWSDFGKWGGTYQTMRHVFSLNIEFLFLFSSNYFGSLSD